MLRLDFTGKNVLVTGGGRGLGKACALAYADCGADVFIGNRREDEGMKTVGELRLQAHGRGRETGRGRSRHGGRRVF